MEALRAAARTCATPPGLGSTRLGAFSASASELPRRSMAGASAGGGGGDGDRGQRRKYDALLLDAGGTLLQLASPVEDTYASIGRKYGP